MSDVARARTTSGMFASTKGNSQADQSGSQSPPAAAEESKPEAEVVAVDPVPSKPSKPSKVEEADAEPIEPIKPSKVDKVERPKRSQERRATTDVRRWSVQLPGNPELVVEAATEELAKVAYLRALCLVSTDRLFQITEVADGD